MARKPHTYWDEGITLVSSCTPCSPGCDNCWALAMERRFGKEGQVTFHPERLDRFSKEKPIVFSVWNDLYHEAISHEDRGTALIRMNIHDQHTYLILTKRVELCAGFCSESILPVWCGFNTFPNNIWHGLTVCNQQEADEKISIFMKVPGKKFLSIEPILGEIEMGDGFDAVVLGCETGANARPMNLDWAYSIAVQCELAGIPLFIKALTVDGKPNHSITFWPDVLRIRQRAW